MRKKILFLSATILFFLTICIIYLSIYGIKTNSFNNFINNKVKDYNSKLILQLDEVYIKLNFNEFAININAKNSNLIANSNQIKISNMNMNIKIKYLKNYKKFPHSNWIDQKKIDNYMLPTFTKKIVQYLENK